MQLHFYRTVLHSSCSSRPDADIAVRNASSCGLEKVLASAPRVLWTAANLHLDSAGDPGPGFGFLMRAYGGHGAGLANTLATHAGVLACCVLAVSAVQRLRHSRTRRNLRR